MIVSAEITLKFLLNADSILESSSEIQQFSAQLIQYHLLFSFPPSFLLSSFLITDDDDDAHDDGVVCF